MCDPSGAGKAYRLVVSCVAVPVPTLSSSQTQPVSFLHAWVTPRVHGTSGHTSGTQSTLSGACNTPKQKRIVPASSLGTHTRTNASAGTKPEREACKRVHTWSGPLDPSIRVKLGRTINKQWVITCRNAAHLHVGLQCK